MCHYTPLPVLVIDIELPEAPLATISTSSDTSIKHPNNAQTLMTTLPMMNPKYFQTIHETRVIVGDEVAISAFFVQDESTREGEAGIRLQLVQAMRIITKEKDILTRVKT